MKDIFFRDFQISATNPLALPVFDYRYKYQRLALPHLVFAIDIQRQSLSHIKVMVGNLSLLQV